MHSVDVQSPNFWNQTKYGQVEMRKAKSTEWRCRGSNPGPFTCKANALPLSYIPSTEHQHHNAAWHDYSISCSILHSNSQLPPSGVLLGGWVNSHQRTKWKVLNHRKLSQDLEMKGKFSVSFSRASTELLQTNNSWTSHRTLQTSKALKVFTLLAVFLHWARHSGQSTLTKQGNQRFRAQPWPK